MLKKEIRYDFQKRLMSIHRPDRRDLSLQPGPDEWQLPDGICIVVDKDAETVIHTAAKDFLDYLLVSMGVSARMAYTAPSGCCKESAPSRLIIMGGLIVCDVSSLSFNNFIVFS